MLIFSFLSVLFDLGSLVVADSMLEKVQNEGVKIECHYITTEDGYILRLYHLLHPQHALKAKSIAKPMFLMHGLIATSQDYVLYRNSSIAYYFYDRGFDIWLGNARGNTFSRNHTTLHPEMSEFWQFSWHEIGVYDLPAMIDFVLNYTGHNRLIYVGHSQGGTSVCVLLSERPEYNQKLSSVHILAGAIIMDYYNYAMYPMLKNLNYLRKMIEKYELYEFMSSKASKNTVSMLIDLCGLPMISDLCKFILELCAGEVANYDHDYFMDLMSILPNGASYLQFLHFGQSMRFGKFRRLDHGPVKNLKLYGNAEPPEYNFSNIQTKMHIIYGTADSLVKVQNFPILIDKMGRSVVAVNRIDLFNHFDFLVGQLAHTVPPMILRVINDVCVRFASIVKC